MHWWPLLPGVALVVVALRDVFHTLWHPSGEGVLSGALTRVLWAGARRRGRRAGALVGPVTVVATIVVWVALLVLGFALVHWPFLGDGYAYSDTVVGPDRRGFVDAVYVSGVLLATLGLGDVLPLSWPLRLLAPTQALVGFALLTAAVSWLIQLEAALARRRALARYLSLVRRAGAQAALGTGALDRVADGLARARVDLEHSTVTYVFTDPDEATALAAALPWAVRAAEGAVAHDDPEAAAAARAVLLAADDLLALLDAQFLHLDGADRDARLRAFAGQHGYAAEAS